MSDILTTATDEGALLSNKDILVLWTGANDISKNNTKEALRSLTKFIKGHKGINIILIHTLRRYDLSSTSCVNKEVLKFNRQVKKIIKLNSNVKLMEVELQRQHFTRHGQHLNLSGKELVALVLAKKIDQLLTKLETNPIQMQWKEENLHGENLPAQNGVKELTLLKNCKKPEKNKCQSEKTEVNNKKIFES
jgi:hypothetical protein